MSYYKQVLWIFIFFSIITMIIIYLKMIVIYHPHPPKIDKYNRFFDRIMKLVSEKNYAEVKYIETPDNFLLDSLYLKNPDSDKCIIFFHGNAGNISMRYEMIKFLYNYSSVFIFDYRAYGRSSGDDIDLSCNALQIDSVTIWNYVTFHLGYKPNKISLLGESLGCSLAIYLAAEVSKTHNNQNYPHALILNSPFYSLESMTVTIFNNIGLNLLGFFLSQITSTEYKSAEWINYVNYQTKIIIAHSPTDEVIPYTEANKLFSNLKKNHSNHENIKFITITGTHNNLGLTDEYIYSLAELFNESD